MRLHFVVEGQTEETFVRELLRPELAQQGIFCDVHGITTGRRGSKVYRGGFVSFHQLRKDLELWMKQETGVDSWFTTMIDLYHLPSDFPVISESRQLADPIKRVEFLEEKLRTGLNHSRFVPYTGARMLRVWEQEHANNNGMQQVEAVARFAEQAGATAIRGRKSSRVAGPARR